MTSRAPTLSGLGHVAACPGSASLPHQRREGTRGTPLGRAIHELNENAIAMADLGYARSTTPQVNTIAATHDLTPDDAGRLAFLAEHLRLPVPPGALAEVPLGYFPDGSVRRIEGGAGDYPDVGQWLSGTLDAMWVEPGGTLFEFHEGDLDDPRPSLLPDQALWIVDWKTGADEHVPPIARNWQLRAGALLAARWTGATRVIPAICYVNAAECAAALREERQHRASAREATENNEMVAAAEFERLADECGRRAREGRWEVGEALDVAALDAIEVKLRAVLSAARGESDVSEAQMARRGSGVLQEGLRDREAETWEGVVGLPPDGGAALVERDRSVLLSRLILGPHCEFCPARAACPAFGAAARQLVGKALLAPRSHELFTPDERAHLAGIIPALRRTLDAAEEAVRAGGPVLLADGRVYGPALEETTSYATRPTYEALAAVVGEAAADEAFEATTASLKRALEGQGRGAFGRLRADVEARGGLVPGGREVWRRRWQAVPVKVVSDGVPEMRQPESHGDGVPSEVGEGVAGEARDQGDDASTQRVNGVRGVGFDPGGVREDRGAPDGADPPVEVTARFRCPTCHRSYARTKGGALRKHAQIGGGLYCVGEATAAQEALAQLTMGGQ